MCCACQGLPCRGVCRPQASRTFMAACTHEDKAALESPDQAKAAVISTNRARLITERSACLSSQSLH